MFAMRHPVIPTHLSSTQRAAAAAASASVTPSPSLPGLAFAVCTAALPLLQRRDETVACAVLNTLKVALPMVGKSRSSSHRALLAPILSLTHDPPPILFLTCSHRCTDIPPTLLHNPTHPLKGL